MNYTDADGRTRLVPLGGDLPVVLRFMQRHGSSVVLTYGEDTDQWECSWITGGERTTRVARDPVVAAQECLKAACDNVLSI